MPGDTKIKRVPVGNGYGWVDIDNPSNVYSARRLARDARRSGRLSLTPVSAQPSTVIRAVASDNSHNDYTTYSTLQQRLYDRLTLRQGVTPADAHDIITSHGYNAAASYGHMRAAGANHSEAEAVIDLGSPDVSLAYGRARATGYNHTGALQKALRDTGDDD